MKKYFKLNPLTISLFVIVIVVTGYVFGVPILDILELKTIDLRFQSRGEISPNPNVVLAVIDEKSLDQEGKWIWPRSKLADLIIKISDAGARVIAFDIGFLEPDDKNIIHAINTIQNKAEQYDIQNAAFTDYLEKLRLQSDYDTLLADVIKNSSARIVLGYFFQIGPEASTHLNEKQILEHIENSKGSLYKIVRYASELARNAALFDAQAPQSNIRKISDATPYSGFFNMFPDPDGAVRWMPTVFRLREMLYAPLSVVAAGAYLGEPISLYVSDDGVEEVTIGATTIPTDKFGRVLINYRGPGKTFPHVPITDILRGNTPSEMLKDKIVIVGATAVGIYDLRITPFGTVFPGLEIHANVIDNILSNTFLHQPDWAGIFDVMIIVIAGIFLGIALPRLGVVRGALASALIFFGYILLCQYMFSEKGWVLNLVYPLSLVLILYVGITTYKYLLEAKHKRFIREAFSTYLSPSVVKQLVESPEKLVLGGEERDITAFFSDVQSFTSISENLTPNELVELLNEFLTEMTDIILNHEGTVDKFEGDAIIAFFGAPNYLENHAESACMSCIAMQKKLAELRKKWGIEGKPELMMRIGLCSGSAVVGNMGSKNRMDYTMMGDTVNTAARLEGVNKIYGTYTMMGDVTYNTAGGWSFSREIDLIHVIGKKEPVRIYELFGYPGDFDERFHETVDFYAKGLYAYRDCDWNKATMFFLKALSLMPDDGPSKTMLARCSEYKRHPPDKNWAGTFSMTEK
ncbi:MAG: adenylate/guanylate cyclase domain-containing protein [Pseudomonadota bacterium]